MRRALPLVVLAAFGVTVAAPATAHSPTSIGVSEREWRVALYKTRVPTGVLRLNAHNYGEDGHDLAIRNRAGKVLASVPEIEPGAGETLRVRVRRPGRYVVFCSLEGHEAKGMRARLTVVKRKRG